MYDAIIVGARCAGSPTAMLLARKGYRVLLLDRDTFPSDTMSTHLIWSNGIASLQRWGLLDQIIATNCPDVAQKVTFDAGPLMLTGTPTPVEGIRQAYAPRRYLLDKILVDAAVAAGAELREGFSVQDLLWDGDKVVGIRGRSADGNDVTEQARIVIGADGMHSFVARSVQAPAYNERPAQQVGYYSYFSGIATEGTTFYARDGSGFAVIPTNDDLTLIVAGLPNARFHDYRADIEGTFLRIISQSESLAERVAAGRREERFMGTADLPNFFRRPYGPGWALVGDAGYYRDPITAQGISDAFRDAELVTAALDASFADGLPLAETLAGYEQQRNQAVGPMYDFTCQLAGLQAPPPEMQQLLGALLGNQEDTDAFFGMMTGSLPIPQFFAPENVGRIMQQAGVPA